MALAKEEAGEIKAASYLRNMNHIEAQSRLFRNIIHMEGKIKGGSTSKVTTKIEGRDVEVTSKVDIEKLCATENERSPSIQAESWRWPMEEGNRRLVLLNLPPRSLDPYMCLLCYPL